MYTCFSTFNIPLTIPRKKVEKIQPCFRKYIVYLKIVLSLLGHGRGQKYGKDTKRSQNELRSRYENSQMILATILKDFNDHFK